jgi:hypothetical protein
VVHGVRIVQREDNVHHLPVAFWDNSNFNIFDISIVIKPN